MKSLDLYKKLPKKNCGRCGLKACMPFAVSVVRGDSDIGECVLLSPETVEELRPALVEGDWREELIAKLSKEVSGLDLASIAPGIGAVMQGEDLKLVCFGREFLVSRDGAIRTEGRTTPWIRILILHYIRTAGSEPLTGKWVSFSELRAGMVKNSSFIRECEEPLLELFQREENRTFAELMRMGGLHGQGFPTDNAWVLYLLPRVPIAVLYWPAEEEFPARVKILFDSTADKYLDVESLMFLVEGLVKNIEIAFG
ncbi:MAG: DUF3786 domain-containing protein [Nitrospiraceae bacterium]|nr:DUF3786 domain-containing protein [Nitrospiraceae bacterium]